jgi:UDP-N-acetylglucosamine 4,6-dehydratase
VIGIRPGEKLHEEMISENDARRTVDCGSHYVVLPDLDFGRERDPLGEPVPEGFQYSSDRNDDWLDAERLYGMLDE